MKCSMMYHNIICVSLTQPLIMHITANNSERAYNLCNRYTIHKEITWIELDRQGFRLEFPGDNVGTAIYTSVCKRFATLASYILATLIATRRPVESWQAQRSETRMSRFRVNKTNPRKHIRQAMARNNNILEMNVR